MRTVRLSMADLEKCRVAVDNAFPALDLQEKVQLLHETADTHYKGKEYHEYNNSDKC